MVITVENKSGRNTTLLNIGGAFVHPDTNALLKNVSTFSKAIDRWVRFNADADYHVEIWGPSHQQCETSSSLLLPQPVSD